MRIPEHLRESHYGGRKEITKTLGTSDHLLAFQIAQAWSRNYKQQFMAAESEASTNAPNPAIMPSVMTAPIQLSLMSSVQQEQPDGG